MIVQPMYLVREFEYFASINPRQPPSSLDLFSLFYSMFVPMCVSTFNKPSQDMIRMIVCVWLNNNNNKVLKLVFSFVKTWLLRGWKPSPAVVLVSGLQSVTFGCEGGFTFTLQKLVAI